MNFYLKAALILSFSGLLFACVGVSPKSYFYTLNAAQSKNNTAQNAYFRNNLRLQIILISIDETVDRPQIVITNGQYQVQLLEQQRWAQPLKYEIGRVLAQNINQYIPNSIVSAYPHQLSNPSVQLQLQVTAFESSLTAPAKISVSYTLSNTITKKKLSATKEYVQGLVVAKQTASIANIIEAHNQNIMQLSQDLILEISKI